MAELGEIDERPGEVSGSSSQPHLVVDMATKELREESLSESEVVGVEAATAAAVAMGELDPPPTENAILLATRDEHDHDKIPQEEDDGERAFVVVGQAAAAKSLLTMDEAQSSFEGKVVAEFGGRTHGGFAADAVPEPPSSAAAEAEGVASGEGEVVKMADEVMGADAEVVAEAQIRPEVQASAEEATRAGEEESWEETAVRAILKAGPADTENWQESAARAILNSEQAARELVEARLDEVTADLARAEAKASEGTRLEALARLAADAAQSEAQEATFRMSAALAAQRKAEARAAELEATLDAAKAAAEAQATARVAEAKAKARSEQVQADTRAAEALSALANAEARAAMHHAEALGAESARARAEETRAAVEARAAEAAEESSRLLSEVRAQLAEAELLRAEAEKRVVATEARAAEAEAMGTRVLQSSAERVVENTGVRAGAVTKAAEAERARAEAEKRAIESVQALAKAEAATVEAVKAHTAEAARASFAEQVGARKLCRALELVSSSQARQAELELKLQAADRAFEEIALNEKHARAREEELRSRELAQGSVFGGPVRSREKFERQVQLTQELERLLLKKDHEIARLRTVLGARIDSLRDEDEADA